MKCIPITLSGRFVAAPNLVIEIEEVLEARIVEGPVSRSSSVNRFDLIVSFSVIASTIKLALPQSCQISCGLDAPDNRLLVSTTQTFLIDIPLQTLIDCTHPALGKLISHVVHNDVITGSSGNLGDAIAHGAGAHYSNKFTHCPGTPNLSPIGRGWRWEILTVALLLDIDRKSAWRTWQSVLWPIIKQLTGFAE